MKSRKQLFVEGLIINFLVILFLFLIIAFFILAPQKKDLSSFEILTYIINKHLLKFIAFSLISGILGGVFWCTVIFKIKVNKISNNFSDKNI